MELLEDIFIRCGRCGQVIGIHKEGVEFETSVYDHGDNGMGEEIEYLHDGFLECEHCGNEITFKICGYEYPVGDYAYPEYTRVEQMIMDIAQNPDMIYNISSRELEEIIERVLQDEGFETALTQQTRDGGRDIIATKYEMGKPVVFYIECKRYGRKNAVGVSIVRSLYGVQSSDRVNKAILVTTGHVTGGARRFVEQQNTMMSIIDVDEIHELIHRSAMKFRG